MEVVVDQTESHEAWECGCLARPQCRSIAPSKFRWNCTRRQNHKGNHMACTPTEHRFAEWNDTQMWEPGEVFATDVVRGQRKDLPGQAFFPFAEK